MVKRTENRLMTKGHRCEVEYIFRSYDIRGIYGKDLDESVMVDIGKAFGVFIPKKEAVIARDVRLSGQLLEDAFISGFLSTGKNIEEIGILPLGVAMFHAWKNKKYLAYITASHLPKEWNGAKFFHSNGTGFVEKENLKVKKIFLSKKFLHGQGKKTKTDNASIIDLYKKQVMKYAMPEKKMKIVIDCGNGCAGLVAPPLFEAAGFDVVNIYKEPDGNFPNRLPDPIDEELFMLKQTAKKTDFGIGFDGDADRMAMVSGMGKTLTPEEASYIILTELLKKHGGPIIANVECSRVIDKIANEFKREVIRVPVGHTFMMEAAHKNHAVFGVEPSRHYIIPSLFPFDDSLAISYYAACVLSKRNQNLAEIAETIPKMISERFTYTCPDSKKFILVENLKKVLKAEYDKVNTMDGVRVDLDSGWVLIRAANTSPVIRMTIETDTIKDFGELKVMFLNLLEKHMKKFGLGLIPEKK
jgi:phosphomannomutase